MSAKAFGAASEPGCRDVARLLFDRVRSYAINPGVAQHLWVVSEEMFGEGFDLL